MLICHIDREIRTIEHEYDSKMHDARRAMRDVKMMMNVREGEHVTFRGGPRTAVCVLFLVLEHVYTALGLHRCSFENEGPYVVFDSGEGTAEKVSCDFHVPVVYTSPQLKQPKASGEGTIRSRFIYSSYTWMIRSGEPTNGGAAPSTCEPTSHSVHPSKDRKDKTKRNLVNLLT